MVAIKTLLCFVLPTALVIGTAVGGYVNTLEELNQQESSTEEERKCPPRERWDSCASCQKNCTTINDNPGACTDECRPGCVCVKKYIRGPHGQCIKPKDCAAEVKCPEGEHHEPCGFACQRTCYNKNETLIPCLAVCLPACVCNNGTVRSELPFGKCIEPKECSKSDEKDENFCPRNEEFAACKGLCELDCSTRNKTIPRNCGSGWCVSSCRCVSGYVRGPKGTCIKPDECPSDDDTNYPVKRVCPENEVWSGRAHCQTNCTHPKGGLCPRIIVEGCICREGYKRAPNGHCIPKDHCPKEDEESFCPRNEEFSACKGLCEFDCSTRNRTIPRNCGSGWCVSSCRCVSRYVRGPKGTCIKPDECPTDDDTRYPVKRVCPENEEWKGDAHCQTNCTHPNPNPCPRIIVEGCVCKKGYQREPNGRCVPENKCPGKDDESFCPKNEEFAACRGLCEFDCSTRNKTIPRNCGSAWCVSSCRCVSGYVRGPKGTCIKPDECPTDDDTRYPDALPFISYCGPNATYTLLTSSCPDNCTNYMNKNRKCKELYLPFPGCTCKEWFVKMPDGRCIKYDQCPKEKKPEDCTNTEIWNECGRESKCDDPQGEDRPSGKNCNKGCFCIDGYVRDEKGDCVFPFDCKKLSSVFDDNQFDSREEEHIETEVRDVDDGVLFPIICKRNETMSVCSCSLDCTNYRNQTKNCKICLPGCECKSGYVTGPDGSCILIKDCPRDKLPGDCTNLEYYDSCGSNCPTNCENFNHPERQCVKSCKVGCFCIPGYVRGPKGDCIQPFDCQTASAEA